MLIWEASTTYCSDVRSPIFKPTKSILILPSCISDALLPEFAEVRHRGWRGPWQGEEASWRWSWENLCLGEHLSCFSPQPVSPANPWACSLRVNSGDAAGQSTVLSGTDPSFGVCAGVAAALPTVKAKSCVPYPQLWEARNGFLSLFCSWYSASEAQSSVTVGSAGGWGCQHLDWVGCRSLPR